MTLYHCVSGCGIVPPIAMFDVAGNEALGYAVLAAVIALLPMMGTLVILAIQQYGKIREAWALANANHATLTDRVLPAIEAARAEGENAHAETIRAINGGIAPGTGDAHTGTN